VSRAATAILLAAALATWPLAGHPGVGPAAPVAVAVDMAHLAAMSVWLGGLLAILTAPRDRSPVALWSAWAEPAVGVLAATGLAQAVIQLGPPVALLTTVYGRLLGLKSALVAAALAAASLTRRRRAAVSPGRPAANRMIAGQLGAGAAVLILAAALGVTAPGRQAVMPSATADQPYAAELSSPPYRLRLQIDPARVGLNSVHLYAVGADGGPLAVLAWHATVAGPSPRARPVDVTLRKVTADEEVAQLALPSAGRWRLRVTLRVTPTRQVCVQASVPVDG
jgi:copper transport protein